ncbi:winged helix-turn-helix domain-containing protein [Nitrosomonas communis]
MAIKSSRTDQLVSAQKLLETAKTAAELRAAQAVLFPLELGMTREQMAKNIGLSVRWTCSQRTRYDRITRGEEKVPRTKREHQNRAIATLEQEAQILDEVLVGSAQGRAVVATPLKEKIEERLGKRVVLSTIYRMAGTLWFV